MGIPNDGVCWLFACDAKQCHACRFMLCGSANHLQSFMPPGTIALLKDLLNARSIIGTPNSTQNVTIANNSTRSSTAKLCVFFQQGQCTRGESCRFSHSPTAQRTLCRNFVKGKCTFGASCRYGHGQDAPNIVAPPPPVVSLEVPTVETSTALPPSPPMLPSEHSSVSQYVADDTILLLGEGTFAFSWVPTLCIGSQQICFDYCALAGAEPDLVASAARCTTCSDHSILVGRCLEGLS